MKLEKLFRGHYFVKANMARQRLISALKSDGIWDKLDSMWVAAYRLQHYDDCAKELITIKKPDENRSKG